MLELKICRICLNNNVRLHRITGSEVQDVYEKLTNKVQEDGNLYFACYICYCQLKNCQQLVTKSQRSEELLKQILPIRSELLERPISFLDRLTHGLLDSLTFTNIESLQIPEYNEFINTEKQDESDANEEIVDDGSDVELRKGAPSIKKIKLSDNHNIQHGNANAIESGKKENIFETEANTAPDSNNLSRIVNDENRKLFVKNTFTCNHCGKTCETKAVLVKHISGHKPVTINSNEKKIKNWKSLCEITYIKDSSNKKQYKCQYCNYTHARSSRVKLHIRTHTGEKPFKCQYCSYICSNNVRLRLHIRTHTGEKPFKCQYCNYTCTVNSSLKVHNRIHTGEKPYKCQYCNYTCRSNSGLNRHIKIHTEEKPFKCQYCSYKCIESSCLKTHVRTHTGEKPFKCQNCSYACRQKSMLKSHILVHTGEKPFKCQYCSYACRHKSMLKSHSRIHTGEKPFKCQYCNYISTFDSNLKRHIKTHTDKSRYNENNAVLHVYT